MFPSSSFVTILIINKGPSDFTVRACVCVCVFSLVTVFSMEANSPSELLQSKFMESSKSSFFGILTGSLLPKDVCAVFVRARVCVCLLACIYFSEVSWFLSDFSFDLAGADLTQSTSFTLKESNTPNTRPQLSTTAAESEPPDQLCYNKL